MAEIHHDINNIDLLANIEACALQLVADTRESAVNPYFSEQFRAACLKIMQINVGDYILVHKRAIIAAFERKTYADYIASIQDGRIKNNLKLVDLRQRTGCKTFLIIEGPESELSDPKHKGIESNMFHAMFRDDFYVLRSRDPADTAGILERFTRSIGTLDNYKCKVPIGANIVKPSDNAAKFIDSGARLIDNGANHPREINITGNQTSSRDDAKLMRDSGKLPGETEGGMLANPITVPLATNVVDLLKEKRNDSFIDVLHRLWCCFPGVSQLSAQVLASQFSLEDIILRHISKEQLSSVKLASGRVISITVVNSLLDCSNATELKILTTLPGVSVSRAKRLLADKRLGELLLMSPADLIALCGQKGRSVCGTMLSYLKYIDAQGFKPFILDDVVPPRKKGAKT